MHVEVKGETTHRPAVGNILRGGPDTEEGQCILATKKSRGGEKEGKGYPLGKGPEKAGQCVNIDLDNSHRRKPRLWGEPDMRKEGG